MFIKQLFPLLLFWVLPLTAVATEVPLTSVIETLETPFKTSSSAAKNSAQSIIHDFQADFFQESQIASIDRVQRGRGKVSFKFHQATAEKAPLAMFRWEYQEPEIQEIVSDGRTMWVYLPENRQVIESDISKLDNRQGDNPVTLLNGLGNLLRDFNIQWGEPKTDKNGNYILELQPRKESLLIQSLQIIVAEEAVRQYVEKKQTGKIFPVLVSLVEDPNGNKTRIEFLEGRVNQQLAVGVFHFTPPEGVEIVTPGDVQMKF